MSKLVRDLVNSRGIDARLAIDAIIVDGHLIANPTSAPEDWRLGRACSKRAEYAVALGWTKLHFPPSSQSAYSWLLDRPRAIIVPAHQPFYIPREKHQSIHRSLVFWRYAKHGVDVDKFDDRACPGIETNEQRISCCSSVGFNAAKMLSLAGEELIVLAPEQLAEMRLFGTIKMGCGEGWREDGSYTHPSRHLPPFCALDEAIRFGRRRPEHHH